MTRGKNVVMGILALALVGRVWAAGERGAPLSLAVGTQTIGVRYQFTEGCALVETAREIEALGSDILKIAITPKYDDDYQMERDARIRTVLDLVERKPSFLQVMDMPFRHLMLWVYPFSDSKSAFKKGSISARESAAVYRELYDFTAYLLKRYSGSGKTFYIGNWEGDWHVLREIYDYNLDPAPEAIAGAIEWFKLREKAVADARRETPHEAVDVYFYVELNHVAKAMDAGRPSLVNQVLPHIRTDYVSWSSYDITKPVALLGEAEGRERVQKALDYIESHLPESDIKGKRVFVGEYGFETASFGTPCQQMRYTASVMKWCLEWGCPFVLYWELYCNEIDPLTGKHRGYWLIDDTGVKQPAWSLHKAFLERAHTFVDAYRDAHGGPPDQQTFNRAAARWIDDFTACEELEAVVPE